MSTYTPSSPAGGYRSADQFPAPSGSPRRRARPWMMFVGVALAAVGGLGAGWATLQAGTRSQVLAVARPIPYGHQITAEDLTVARIAADPALSPIAAGDENSVIGKYAATNIPAGSLLVSDDLATGPIPGPGQTLVGVGLKNTQMPAGGVRAQDKVSVVSTPGPNDDPKTAAPASIQAVVVTVGTPDDNGTVVVSVQVAVGDSATLAAWNATGRIALIIEPRG